MKKIRLDNSLTTTASHTKMASCRKGTREYIVNADDFGYPIMLNFNRQGSSANTVIGGIFTTIIKSALLFFLALKIYGLTIHQDDDYLTIESSLKRIELQSYNFLDLYKENDMGMMPFFSLV